MTKRQRSAGGVARRGLEEREAQVGIEILRQLGGAERFAAMAGGCALIGPGRVTLRWPSRRDNCCVVMLTRGDVYTVEFWRAAGAKLERTKVYGNVAVADLRGVFEGHTGLRLKL